ncbi:hypothetical protein K458DRAFT_414026 [Lentithecium fluviatile CBS 122367]|uniref:Uncharacterized protein n=1 Tax=Lentithecium fluviatile CBS 122367 TaxID=1168545 RepID=A0A6G1JH46_9PLEO|nr:hypothetical protein K458DRAFT_414026 [Lentithecium fluviatile CBS 122367]
MIHLIVNQHFAECLAASDPKCSSCSKPTKAVLTSPMSWLHLSDDPFVNILLTPVCETSGRCESRHAMGSKTWSPVPNCCLAWSVARWRGRKGVGGAGRSAIVGRHARKHTGSPTRSFVSQQTRLAGLDGTESLSPLPYDPGHCNQ